MNPSLLNVLIPAAAGMLGVVVGSFKPVLDWNIEKRRMRREDRKQLLKDFRSLLLTENITQAGIVTSIPYSQLRPKLSNELTEKFEKRYEPKLPGNLRDWMTIELVDELHKIEKEWGLL
jgi:hypothetical protein